VTGRFTSRKFLAVVVSALASIAAGLSGEIAWQEATRQVVALVLAYLGVEGTADALARRAATRRPPAGTG
jgi:hypothetical protein